jgi:methylglutaconyl-CoA hydratase
LIRSILTEIDQGVGIITLNRPERRNTLDARLIDELAEAVGVMTAEPAVRVIVMSSTGEFFCAGRLPDAGVDSGEQDRDAAENTATLAELLRHIAESPKPVIARVQGPAAGSGVGLIAACDIAVTTFDTSFTLANAGRGSDAAAISASVTAAIGERYVRRYLLTAERFSAAEAYRIGLVHEMVVDDTGLDEAVGDIIDALLNNNADAIAEYKSMLAAAAPQRGSRGVLG